MEKNILSVTNKIVEMRTNVIGEIVTKDKYKFIMPSLMAELIEDTLNEVRKNLLTSEDYEKK